MGPGSLQQWEEHTVKRTAALNVAAPKKDMTLPLTFHLLKQATWASLTKRGGRSAVALWAGRRWAGKVTALLMITLAPVVPRLSPIQSPVLKGTVFDSHHILLCSLPSPPCRWRSEGEEKPWISRTLLPLSPIGHQYGD